MEWSLVRPATRRRGLFLFLLTLLLPAVLTGCLSRGDSFSAVVTITEPKAGTARSTDTVDIFGYAMDDRGVAAIRVDGSDLLASPQFASERGKRLVHFGFRGVTSREGEITYRIEVEDVDGQVTALPYSLTVDTTPPTLELEATRLSSGRYSLKGVARDNLLVSSIRIGGVPVSIVPAAEVSFEFNNIDPESNVIEVIDSAGNRHEGTF
jgi:hypothetical protein